MSATLRIEKMHCGSCAKRVTNAILGVEPSADIKIDIEGRTVIVAPAAKAEEMLSALEAAGYPAVVAA